MQRNGNAYEVTGPGPIEKGAPAYGAALSFAQYAAGRLASEGTFYVRHEGQVVAHVTRLGDGVVETRPVGKHEPVVEQPVAIAVALDEIDEADRARDAERYGPAVRPMETYGAGSEES